MTKRKQSKIAVRSLLVIAAIIALVAGVTYASLQSQAAVLKGNTIQTASANLQLSHDGTSYGSTLDGFVFGNLVPGGAATPTAGYPVYLKNAGSTPLALTISLGKSVTNLDAVDLSKVFVTLTPLSGGNGQRIALADLAPDKGGVALTYLLKLLPSQALGYSLQVSMEADALHGPSATIGDIDFSFGATAVN